MGNFLRRHSRELTASTLTLCSLFGVVACADDVPSTKTIAQEAPQGSSDATLHAKLPDSDHPVIEIFIRPDGTARIENVNHSRLTLVCAGTRLIEVHEPASRDHGEVGIYNPQNICANGTVDTADFEGVSFSRV